MTIVLDTTMMPPLNWSDSLNESAVIAAEQEPINVIFWSLIDGLLFLAITTGNILTITVILRRRKLVSNLFVLSLACSDLSVGLVLPYHMAFYLMPRLGHNFDHCMVRLSLVLFACIASMFNILAIAADRFFAVALHLNYPKYMTHIVARVIIGAAWVSSFTVTAVSIYWRQPWRGRCELGAVVLPILVHVIHVPAFTLLFAFMCGFYARIIYEARRQVRRMQESTPGKADSFDNWKSLQVLMLVMGSFTLSYTPFFILLLLSVVSDEKYFATSIVYKITNSLAMANSAINPVIYTWKNQEFKEEMAKLITSIFCKSDDAFLRNEQGPSHGTVTTIM